MNDKRRFKRVRVTNSSVICRGKEDDRICLSMVFDLSEGGMGFVTREDIGVGAEVRFGFQLPENGSQFIGSKRESSEVHGVGNVVWAVPLKDVFGEHLIRCGVQFKNLPPTSLKTVKTYIKKSSDKKV